MMTNVKQRAVELINRMSDEKIMAVIAYVQNLQDETTSPVSFSNDAAKNIDWLEQIREERLGDDGSLAYLFKDYVDDGIREPIIDFGEAAGNEKW
jgi:hypothetical protein